MPDQIQKGRPSNMLKKFGVAVGAAGLIAAAFSGNAQAFPKKDITFVIPYKAGGGFDAYVRKVSPIMEKFLPKKVNVVPKNIPAAGGRKALSDVWRSKPDGHMLILTNMPGMLLDKILGKKTRYEIEKFTWVGQMASSPYILGVAKQPKNGKKPYKTWKDLKGKKLKYAVTSPSSTAYVAGKIMANRLGLDVTFLPGYKGSSTIQLEIIKGNTDLSLFAYRSYAKYAKSGDLVGVLSFEKKSPVKGVPTVAEIGYPDLQALATERIVATAPNTPAKIVKVLETALLKALNTDEMKKWKRPVDPKNAAGAAKRVKELVAFYSKYRKVLAKR